MHDIYGQLAPNGIAPQIYNEGTDDLDWISRAGNFYPLECGWWQVIFRKTPKICGKRNASQSFTLAPLVFLKGFLRNLVEFTRAGIILYLSIPRLGVEFLKPVPEFSQFPMI
jgi:hypothetical protein